MVLLTQISEAKKRANKKWNDANMKERYDRVQLVLPKGEKERVQAAALASGESVNGYIGKAISQRMERDGFDGIGKSPGGGFGISEGVPDQECS